MKNVSKCVATFLFVCLTGISCTTKDITEDGDPSGDSTPDFILGKWEAVSVSVCNVNESGETLSCDQPYEYGQGRLVLGFDDAGKYTIRQGQFYSWGKYKVVGNKIYRDASVSELAVSGDMMTFTDTGTDEQQGNQAHWKSTLVLHKVE